MKPIHRTIRRLATMLTAVCLCALAWAPDHVEPQTTDRAARFDYLVRSDFFAGVAGDRARLARAMKLCEDTLARDPRHAEAMVWHGAGLLVLAGQAFQAGDPERGSELWPRALRQMQDAVTLAPDVVGVRIARGATLLQAARVVPSPDVARDLTVTAMTDYEKTLEVQRPTFERLSVHARGELLAGLVDGWHRLGHADKAREYVQQIVRELPETAYQAKAQAWLEREAGRMDVPAISCTTGCHRK